MLLIDAAVYQRHPLEGKQLSVKNLANTVGLNVLTFIYQYLKYNTVLYPFEMQSGCICV